MKIHDCAQYSSEWWALRMGRPTASCFDKIVQSDGSPSKSMKKYATRLANELLAGEKLDAWAGNESTRRGMFLEDDARREYSVVYDVDCKQVGFITDDAETYGCSPDFLVGEDGGGQIKCINGDDHSAAILRYQTKGDFEPGYIQQCQGEMLVTERKWWDLIFWHPALPMLVIRLERDELFLDKLRDGIEKTISMRDEIFASLRRFADPSDVPEPVTPGAGV
jgi:YqaJ-like recombinase protein